MMSKQALYYLSICLLLVFALPFSAAAQQAGNTLENHGTSSKDVVYDYQDTPDYCFHKQKNFLAKMTDEQATALGEYGFPKFVRHYKAYLEEDILFYKEEIARWQEENMYRMDEINEQVGMRK